jgi:SAM-dependent methyltransferase/GNAT superfamily N-acetyltransferase
MVTISQIRLGRPSEREALGDLHRRSSYVWEEDRLNLDAHPEVLGVAPEAIAEERVRVAVGPGGDLVGFSVVADATTGVCELEDLFVDPGVMRQGIGRALVLDAMSRAAGAGCRAMTVVAHPRNFAFYESLGFIAEQPVSTLFGGPAWRLRCHVGLDPASATAPSAAPAMDDTYTHGHHASVLRSHRCRTAENSAAYLLPHLRPGLSLLDIGCGPGTITIDLAARVAPGAVLGIDREPAVIAEAVRLLQPGRSDNVEFRAGDVYSLDLDDESFDVVHAHQVLQHLTDPVAALAEMRRVLRPGGILAVRDGDYGGFVWAPSDRLLDRWMDLYHDVCRRNGADADAGRYLLGWVRAAGFTAIEPSSSTWTFANAQDRAWWGGMWAERVLQSSFAEQAVAYALSTREELESISGSWRRWAAHEDGFFIVVHAEMIARREG